MGALHWVYILTYLHLVSRDIFLVFISCIHIFRIHSHSFKAHFDKRNHVLLVQITYNRSWFMKCENFIFTKTKKNISDNPLRKMPNVFLMKNNYMLSKLKTHHLLICLNFLSLYMSAKLGFRPSTIDSFLCGLQTWFLHGLQCLTPSY